MVRLVRCWERLIVVVEHIGWAWERMQIESNVHFGHTVLEQWRTVVPALSCELRFWLCGRCRIQNPNCSREKRACPLYIDLRCGGFSSILLN